MMFDWQGTRLARRVWIGSEAMASTHSLPVDLSDFGFGLACAHWACGLENCRRNAALSPTFLTATWVTPALAVLGPQGDRHTGF